MTTKLRLEWKDRDTTWSDATVGIVRTKAEHQVEHRVELTVQWWDSRKQWAWQLEASHPPISREPESDGGAQLAGGDCDDCSDAENLDAAKRVAERCAREYFEGLAKKLLV